MSTFIPLHTDEPIGGGNNLPDLLHRADFSSRIADVIIGTPADSGFVFSIEGQWGSGKTSVLNLIGRRFDELDIDRRPIVCKFNPWMIGNVEDLAQSYLIQLASAIELNHNSDVAIRAAKELINYSYIFSALRLIPGAEPWASMIKGVFDVVGTATEKVADLKKLNTEKRRDAVVAALNALERRIVVFIDDLDRLPPKDVFEMVRLVKAVGDFPSVIYVLCFDPEYVGNALAANNINQSQAYLDKVIQIRLTLPHIDKDDLRSILDREYDLLPKEARYEHFDRVNERISEHYYGGIRYLLETPRDIKRLFNRLIFVEPGCRGEVNLADLIALETIAIKAPAVYDHIRKNPAAYIGQQLGYVESFSESKKVVESFADDRKAALDLVSPSLQNHVRELLRIVFPLVNPHGSGIPDESKGLICKQDRLAIAISFGLPLKEVSLGAVFDFIKDSSKRKNTIDQILAAGKGRRFFEHLYDAIRNNPVVDIVHLAEVIGTAIDTPLAKQEENEPRGVFDFGLCKQAWWAIENSLNELKHIERSAAIKKIAERTDLISLSTYAISFLHAQHGGFQDERALPEDQCWLDRITFQQLSLKWANAMSVAIADSSVFLATECGIVFFRLKRFHPSVLTPLIPAIIDNDQTLDRLVIAIGAGGWDSKKGRYTKFETDTLDFFGGKELLKARALVRLSDLNVTGELRYIYSAIESGKQVYLVDGSLADN